VPQEGELPHCGTRYLYFLFPFFPLRLRFAVIATDICKLTVNHFSLLQSENMEALVQMVVGPPEDVEDEKTRFKYVLLACCC